MNPYVEMLAEGANFATPNAFDWGEVRDVLGIDIPQDFRELLEAGGGGVWFDYVTLYGPGGEWGDNNLLDSVYGFKDLQDFWRGGGSPPIDRCQRTSNSLRGRQRVAARRFIGGLMSRWRTPIIR